MKIPGKTKSQEIIEKQFRNNLLKKELLLSNCCRAPVKGEWFNNCSPIKEGICSKCKEPAIFE